MGRLSHRVRSERSAEPWEPPLPPGVTWEHVPVHARIWALEIAIVVGEENPQLKC